MESVDRTRLEKETTGHLAGRLAWWAELHPKTTTHGCRRGVGDGARAITRHAGGRGLLQDCGDGLRPILGQGLQPNAAKCLGRVAEQGHRLGLERYDVPFLRLERIRKGLVAQAQDRRGVSTQTTAHHAGHQMIRQQLHVGHEAKQLQPVRQLQLNAGEPMKSLK